MCHTPVESPAMPAQCPGDSADAQDDGGDFEESPHSLNFSNGVWKGVLGAGKKGGKLFLSSLDFF